MFEEIKSTLEEELDVPGEIITPDAEFINGEVLSVNGGLVIT